MRKFTFNKLVRDKIAESIRSGGGIVHGHKLSKTEFIQALKDKLVEETAEFELQTEEDPIDTVVDLNEILDALAQALGHSKAEVEAMQKAKRDKRGGFAKQEFIDYVEVPENSTWLEYYLKYPTKYPEITPP